MALSRLCLPLPTLRTTCHDHATTYRPTEEATASLHFSLALSLNCTRAHRNLKINFNKLSLVFTIMRRKQQQQRQPAANQPALPIHQSASRNHRGVQPIVTVTSILLLPFSGGARRTGGQGLVSLDTPARRPASPRGRFRRGKPPVKEASYSSAQLSVRTPHSSQAICIPPLAPALFSLFPPFLHFYSFFPPPPLFAQIHCQSSNCARLTRFWQRSFVVDYGSRRRQHGVPRFRSRPQTGKVSVPAAIAEKVEGGEMM